ncbi:MAG: tetratricopeptide repeat protein, partial [Bdellovibrionales bacterium]|nr:tetratricopeptide repeat protein [Bdellovibrionales bacterium]
MKNTSRLVLPFFFIALSVLISGCTQHKPELSYPSQFEVEVHAAPEREMDLETDRRSQILHNFLAGQLSYVHDDFQGALNYFEAASDLLPEPSPQVHALLAELYLKEQNLEKARTQIEQALTVETENTSYRLLYAGILESLNDFSG